MDMVLMLLIGLVVGAIPSLGDRSQPALLAHRLEAQPPVGELRGHRPARYFFLSPVAAASSFRCVQPLFQCRSPR